MSIKSPRNGLLLIEYITIVRCSALPITLNDVHSSYTHTNNPTPTPTTYTHMFHVCAIVVVRLSKQHDWIGR